MGCPSKYPASCPAFSLGLDTILSLCARNSKRGGRKLNGARPPALARYVNAALRSMICDPPRNSFQLSSRIPFRSSPFAVRFSFLNCVLNSSTRARALFLVVEFFGVRLLSIFPCFVYRSRNCVCGSRNISIGFVDNPVVRIFRTSARYFWSSRMFLFLRSESGGLML